ncbi:uncharacterized protein METZ01_LOCUS210485, partial [marine metagenome]
VALPFSPRVLTGVNLFPANDSLPHVSSFRFQLGPSAVVDDHMVRPLETF